MTDRPRPRLFIFDEAWDVPENTEPPQEPPVCSVPGCGHWEAQHERGHCRVCHTVDPADRKCLHYYFPPKRENG